MIKGNVLSHVKSYHLFAVNEMSGLFRARGGKVISILRAATLRRCSSRIAPSRIAIERRDMVVIEHSFLTIEGKEKQEETKDEATNLHN